MKKSCFAGSLPIKLRSLPFFMSQSLGADSPRWERRNKSWGMRDKETIGKEQEIARRRNALQSFTKQLVRKGKHVPLKTLNLTYSLKELLKVPKH